MKNTGITPIFSQEECSKKIDMKKYRTKYGLELIGFLLLVFGFNFYVAKGEFLFMLLVMLPVIIFIVYVLASISYTIDGSILTVHNAFLQKTKIDIAGIRKIKETNNPLSSPAGSMDRLEVLYGNSFESVLISPINTEDFIKQLLKVNPDIEVKMKPNKTIFTKLAV